MKYIDADKLIAELRKHLIPTVVDRDYDEWEQGKDAGLLQAIDIAESLQQEQPDKYETALEKAREWMPNVNQGGHAILIDIFPELGEGLDPRYGGRKQEQPETIGGVVHHALNVHWLVVNKKKLSARLKQFPEGTEVEILINTRKEETK